MSEHIFWVAMLLLFIFPFTVKPDSGYMGEMNVVFSFLVCWGAIVVCIVGYFVGKLT